MYETSVTRKEKITRLLYYPVILGAYLLKPVVCFDNYFALTRDVRETFLVLKSVKSPRDPSVTYIIVVLTSSKGLDCVATYVR